MPITRLVDTVHILAQLTALHKTISFNARTRRTIGTQSWEHKHIWVVDLEYNSTENDTKLETCGEGATFDEAIQAAWDKFSLVCRKGVGAYVLTPPVEQKAIEADVDA
jgi:hypothetical protein